ncbi:hypothetical protein RFI_32201, partial [Reticulomyxa filosa]
MRLYLQVSRKNEYSIFVLIRNLFFYLIILHKKGAFNSNNLKVQLTVKKKKKGEGKGRRWNDINSFGKKKMGNTDRRIAIEDYFTDKNLQKLECQGHFSRVQSVDMCVLASGDVRIGSTSKDGHVIIWDLRKPESGKKKKRKLVCLKKWRISLGTSYDICVAMHPSGQYVAAGGLGNIVKIYQLQPAVRFVIDPWITLALSEGYISTIKFDKHDTVYFSSGDGKVFICKFLPKVEVMQTLSLDMGVETF